VIYLYRFGTAPKSIDHFIPLCNFTSDSHFVSLFILKKFVRVSIAEFPLLVSHSLYLSPFLSLSFSLSVSVPLSVVYFCSHDVVCPFRLLACLFVCLSVGSTLCLLSCAICIVSCLSVFLSVCLFVWPKGAYRARGGGAFLVSCNLQVAAGRVLRLLH